MSNVAIKVDNVSKSFKLPHEKHNSIKSAFVNIFRKRKTYEKQQVLDKLSFEVNQGDFFAIVGRNGSGKSTLLKLLAGVYVQDKGEIFINGKLTPFIELGVGFNPELTGQENVYLNGSLLGFDRKEINEMYDEIVEFAELENFMDQKLKNYSSGMQVRLAFSIAIRAKSDILLLDEVLAVGDIVFQKKCYDYFSQLKKEKKTVVFVSHDTNAVLEYCNKAILVEDGDIVTSGEATDVVREYIRRLTLTEKNEKNTSKEKRWGTRQVSIESLSLPANNSPTPVFGDKEDVVIDVVFKAQEDVERPVFGLTIADLSGKIIFQSNTLWCDIKVNDMKMNEVVKMHWRIPNAFNTGTYAIAPGVSDKTGTVVYDWREDMKRIKITKQQKSHGYINIDHEIAYEHEH